MENKGRIGLDDGSGEMTYWLPIASAPRDGTVVRLRGHWPRENDIIEIDGLYEQGGYTEGWVDKDRYNIFYPDDWMPSPQPPAPGT